MRIRKIMKILEIRVRIMKIIEIQEIHMRIMKIIGIKEVHANHEKKENHRIQYDNRKNKKKNI